MISLKESRQRVEGVWNLESFVLCTEDDEKPIAQPFGETPLGRLMVLPSGYMSCILTNPESAKPTESGPWASADDSEIASVARTMTTYCGFFKLFEEDGGLRLATQVDIALDPSWIHSVQTRKVTFEEVNGRACMTLVPVQAFPLPDGTRTVGVLKWSRVESQETKSSL